MRDSQARSTILETWVVFRAIMSSLIAEKNDLKEFTAHVLYEACFEENRIGRIYKNRGAESLSM